MYGIGLLWVIPVYLYFCCGSVLISDRLANYLRSKTVAVATSRIIFATWVSQYLLDFAIQTVTMRMSNAYAFAKTSRALRLSAGDRYQYPIYTSCSVATLTTFCPFLL
ncbi:hypothetical protein TWF751_011633 [Orbilia oligospora]|nr:hypothetical protein TWF751_011633 [Orbilia oligospora]